MRAACAWSTSWARNTSGLPIKFAAEPGRANFRPPLLGEHTDEVLRGLGYTDAELAALPAAELALR